jgi:hypothetical protein
MSESIIYTVMIRLMLKRLVQAGRNKWPA